MSSIILIPVIIASFFLYLGVAWVYLKVGMFIMNYIFTPIFSLLVLPTYWYLKKNSEFNSQNEHIAIVLANNYMPERILVYRQNLKKLVKYFKKNNWPYKVYFNITLKGLSSVINNPKATIVYIIGHGNRHGVKISNKETAYYCEFQNSPKKKFIALLHCTHNTGKSLVEYIAQDYTKAFVANKKISNFKVDEFFDEVTKGKVHGAP